MTPIKTLALAAAIALAAPTAATACTQEELFRLQHAADEAERTRIRDFHADFETLMRDGQAILEAYHAESACRWSVQHGGEEP